jgi:hypothetical protein
MPDDTLPPHLRAAVWYAPPPDASPEAQVQAVLDLLTATLGSPRTLANALWAASLLTQVRPALTTTAQWQQWGALAMGLMQDLVLAYDPPRDDA